MAYFKKNISKTGDYENTMKERESVEDVQTYPFVANLERKISSETCKRFGVRASLSEADGKTVTAYYFPSKNSNGEITG